MLENELYEPMRVWLEQYLKGNQFLMERDLFEYLDGNSIPYSILCHDISKNAIYV